jgi:peptidoglycan/LPS O-acetylase OafA/YrhL
MASLSALGARLETVTPSDRDRAVDAVRALAILGVILGHWMVTTVVDHGAGRLVADSPLRHMPQLAPVSWVLQTLAIFFLVGGFSAARSWTSARSRGTAYRTWLTQRLRRLFVPAGLLLAVWTAGLGTLVILGASLETIRTLVSLVLSPLWFLIVFALVTALTPALTGRGSRVASGAAIIALSMVLAVDLIRFGVGGPTWLGWINVLAGWIVPFGIGVAWAQGGWATRRSCLGLLIGGVIGTAVLVALFGYPASMVGVPGEEISNLNPPTLAAVTFGAAQCGLALLVRAPLRRAVRRPEAWAIVAVINFSAIVVFLWHQTALLVVTLGTRPLGTLAGLHTTPDSLMWIAQRLAWLPLIAIVLGLLWAGANNLQRPSPRATRTG